MGEILSAFEFFDIHALQFTMDVLPEVKAPLDVTDQPFYAIIETAGSNWRHDQEKLQAGSPTSTDWGLPNPINPLSSNTAHTWG